MVRTLDHHAEQATVSYQTNQTSFLIFDRHVSDVLPVHHTRRQIDQIIRTNGEKIRRHELADSTIPMLPLFTIRLLEHGPAMNWFTPLLVRQNFSSQSSVARVFRSWTSDRRKRLHY